MNNASRINGGNTAYGRIEADYYPTPPDVTKALLSHLNLPTEKTIWEPACGDGHMAEALFDYGYGVVSSDIRDTGYGIPHIDFLTAACFRCDWIITNPPFKLAEQFIRQCSKHGKPFALLLKSQYWHAASRSRLFSEITPSEVLPLTWRPDFLFKTRGKGSPLMDVMWCVWDGAGETRYKLLEKPIAQPSTRGREYRDPKFGTLMP